MSRRIAIASCAQLPDGDPDDRLLRAALQEQGVNATILAWTEPGVDWAGFDATVIRSTWDYTGRRSEFLEWAGSVPRLFNPAQVILSNSDKRYLAGLAVAGIPVVPTEFIEPGESLSLPRAGEFVVKPSVGAGSKGAGRFDADQPDHLDLARQHAADLHQHGRTVMVQPYFDGVDAHGETALIFIDGQFSHAICKSAMLPPDTRHDVSSDSLAAAQLFVAESITERRPSDAELTLAERVIRQVSDDALLYARIDLLPGPDGPVVIEVELTEPSLFLSFADGAADRLAEAIVARADRAVRSAG